MANCVQLYLHWLSRRIMISVQSIISSYGSIMITVIATNRSVEVIRRENIARNDFSCYNYYSSLRKIFLFWIICCYIVNQCLCKPNILTEADMPIHLFITLTHWLIVFLYIFALMYWVFIASSNGLIEPEYVKCELKCKNIPTIKCTLNCKMLIILSMSQCVNCGYQRWEV